MPLVSTTLSDLEQTVTRPVIYSILGQIQKITKIRQDAVVMFQGDSNVYSTSGSTIESDKNKDVLFNATNILHIDITYDHEDDGINTMDSFGLYTHPIFTDEKLGIHISPIYSKTDVTINFSYRTASKTEAIRWRDDLRMRLSQRRDGNIHRVDYSYSVPLAYVLLLRLIHGLRETAGGYGESFVEYLRLYGTDRLTLMSDVSGNDISLTVAESQGRIVGIYDISPLPEKPEKNSDDSTWVVSFSYKFTYDKPIAASMKYPITVHNQSLPLSYVDFNEDDINLNRKNLVEDGRLKDLGYFEYDSQYNRITTDKLYIRIPEFDDYRLDQIVKGTGTVFTALCSIDPDDTSTILNLNELGDVVIDRDILDFIKDSEYPYIHKPYFSILNVSIYRDDNLLEYESVTCDSNLNLVLRTEPNIRKQYRVRFSILADINALTEDAVDRLKGHPKAFVKIISSINEILAIHPDFGRLSDKNKISTLEFSAIYRLLTGTMMNQSGGSSGRHYYGKGLSASSIPGLYNLLKDIDPRVIKDYMDNTISTKTVLVNRVMALKRDI